MSDTLHPIVEVALELLDPNQQGELILDPEARSTLIEVIEDVAAEDLPLTIFYLAEFAEMVRIRHHSPEGAEQLLEVAEQFIGQLETHSAAQRSAKLDDLSKGRKFLGLNADQRPVFNATAPKSVMTVRDVVQSWRGVIPCS